MMKKYKIENLCTVRSSKRIFANQYTNDGIPFYRGKEITLLSLGQKISDLLYINDKAYDDIKATGVPKENDILITAVGTIGSVWLIDHNAPFYFKDGNIIWLSSINADIALPKYLKYLLTSSAFQRKIEEISIGSNQKALTIDALKKQEIDVPTLNIQQHIVDILGTLDDKIENNSKKAEEYEKMIELYFEQLLSEKTNEWNEQSLLDIAEYTNGLAMQKFRPRGIDYIPVVKIKELSQGRTDSNSEQADVAIGNKFIIDDGDIVFAWSGTLMVKIWCGGKAGLNQHLFKVTSEKHPKWFVYLWTKHHLIKFQNIAKGKAVTMGHIKRDDLAKSSAFIPPSNTFAQYDRIIAPIYERIVILQQENRKLMSLKSRYLQRFFG